MKRHRMEVRLDPWSYDQEWWEGFCELTATSDQDLIAREETERSILNGDEADLGGEG